MITLLCINTAHAEFFKCVNASGSTVYSDNPCDVSKQYKQQSLNIEVPPPVDINVGYSKFTRGLINGYTGTFRIKDSIAHIKKKDKTINVDLWLYPFRLSTEEIDLVKNGALIGRGELKPVRFNFSFPARLSDDISYKEIAITGLFLENDTLITASVDQWYKLTESIKFQYLPEEGKMSFVMKGKIDNYSIFINTKSYIYDRGAKPVNTEWERSLAKPLAELASKSSIFGVLNYPYGIRPNLLARTPKFSIKDLRNDTWSGSNEKTYDDITHTYSISGLKPSKHVLYVSLEDSTEFTRSAIKPGEMYARKEFVIEDENKPVRVDVDMISLIHLLKPVDNNYHIPNNKPDEYISYTSPLEFVWTPLSDDTIYKCIIRGGHKKPLEIDLKEPNLTINLTPGTYHFVLSAYKDDVKTGAMRLHNKLSYRFDYVFIVKETQEKI